MGRFHPFTNEFELGANSGRRSPAMRDFKRIGAGALGANAFHSNGSAISCFEGLVG